MSTFISLSVKQLLVNYNFGVFVIVPCMLCIILGLCKENVYALYVLIPLLFLFFCCFFAFFMQQNVIVNFRFVPMKPKGIRNYTWRVQGRDKCLFKYFECNYVMYKPGPGFMKGLKS